MEGLALKVLLVIFGALCTFVLGLIAWLIKASATAITNSLSEAKDETKKNTIQVAILNSQIEEIKKNNELIPELAKDIQGFHAWKRKVLTDNEASK